MVAGVNTSSEGGSIQSYLPTLLTGCLSALIILIISVDPSIPKVPLLSLAILFMLGAHIITGLNLKRPDRTRTIGSGY